MRNSNGQIQRVRTQKIRNRMFGARRHCRGWLGIWLVVFAASGLVGCSHLKTGAATMGVVGVSSALGLATVPMAAVSGLAAATVSALTAVPTVQAAEITADTVVNKAPDTLWTLLGKITEIGGWGLLLFIGATYLLPMLFTYLLPGPLERKKKKK